VDDPGAPAGVFAFVVVVRSNGWRHERYGLRGTTHLQLAGPAGAARRIQAAFFPSLKSLSFPLTDHAGLHLHLACIACSPESM